MARVVASNPWQVQLLDLIVTFRPCSGYVTISDPLWGLCEFPERKVGEPSYVTWELETEKNVVIHHSYPIVPFDQVFWFCERKPVCEGGPKHVEYLAKPWLPVKEYSAFRKMGINPIEVEKLIDAGQDPDHYRDHRGKGTRPGSP